MKKDAVYLRQAFLQLPELPERLRLWAQDRELEDYVREEAFAARPPRPAPKAAGRQAAIVGSGPAGLGCALELLRYGVRATVFERDDRPGGLLMYGVPELKLPKALLAAKINWLEEQGVRFVCNYELRTPEQFARLQEEFAAVVLCVGSGAVKELPGVTADNRQIFYARDFLAQVTRDALAGTQLADTAGRDVVIVGGGDTGTDCAAVALAQGARSLRQLEQQECLRTAGGHGELCRIVPGDRTVSYCTQLQGLVYDAGGRLSGVKTAKVAWRSAAAGALPRPEVIGGSEELLPAQVLLLATGFSGPERQIFDASGVERSPLGMIAGGAGYFTTTKPGVFAAGDARRGSGMVAWAFTEGRNAAAVCAEYLQNL